MRLFLLLFLILQSILTNDTWTRLFKYQIVQRLWWRATSREVYCQVLLPMVPNIAQREVCLVPNFYHPWKNESSLFWRFLPSKFSNTSAATANISCEDCFLFYCTYLFYRLVWQAAKLWLWASKSGDVSFGNWNSFDNERKWLKNTSDLSCIMERVSVFFRVDDTCTLVALIKVTHFTELLIRTFRKVSFKKCRSSSQKLNTRLIMI